MNRKKLIRMVASLTLLAGGALLLIADSGPPHLFECDGVDYEESYDYTLTCTTNDEEFEYQGTALVNLFPYESRMMEADSDALSFEVGMVNDSDTECVDRDQQRNMLGFLFSVAIDDEDQGLEANLECDDIWTEKGKSYAGEEIGDVQTVKCIPVDYQVAALDEANDLNDENGSGDGGSGDGGSGDANGGANDMVNGDDGGDGDGGDGDGDGPVNDDDGGDGDGEANDDDGGDGDGGANDDDGGDVNDDDGGDANDANDAPGGPVGGELECEITMTKSD